MARAKPYPVYLSKAQLAVLYVCVANYTHKALCRKKFEKTQKYATLIVRAAYDTAVRESKPGPKK